MNQLYRLFCSVSLFVLASPAAFAQEDAVVDLGDVVVSANRTPTDAAKVGSTVSQLSGDEIRRQGQPALQESLSLLPGVSLVQNGGLGTTSSLFIRGANQSYVKVLVDGMDISDPSSTQTQVQFEHLLAGGVERVEVLKGSQSTLHGGNAVAGVVDISSAAERGTGISHSVDAAYGSFDTKTANYALKAGFERGDLALRIGGVKTQGISAFDENEGFPEEDGYENLTLSGTGSFDVSDHLTVFASGRIVTTETEIDGFESVPPFGRIDAPNFSGTNDQRGGRTGATLKLLDERLENTVSVQYYETEREFIDDNPGTFDGKRSKIDGQSTFEVNEFVTVMGGADAEHTTAQSSFSNFSASADLVGGWGQVILSPLEALTLTAGARHDEHDQFGGFDTYRLSAAYTFADTGTTLRGSIGTGFRTPSLFELYSIFGSPALQPEGSDSFDIGIEQRLLEDRLRATVTYFVLDTDNLIEFDFATNRYRNLPGTTERDGVELALTATPVDWASLGLAYTHTRTEQQGGARLARVPEHEIGVSVEVMPIEKLTLNVTAKAVFEVVDTDTLPLDDYVLVNARIGYQATENIEVFARVENLLNEEYQTIRGYGTPDIALYGGISANF